jgi:hypothetical protein
MKILILDDDEIICHKAPSYMVDGKDFTQADITQVNSVPAFFNVFKDDQVWDEIWLDNDLGDPDYLNTGIACSRKLAAMFHDDPLTTVGKFRVTTMNNVAQATIADNLTQTATVVCISPISSMEQYGVSRGNRFIPKTN